MFNEVRTFKNAVKSMKGMQPIPPEVQDLLKGLSYVSKAQSEILTRRDSIWRGGRMEQGRKIHPQSNRTEAKQKLP